ncbi:dipeptide epimerase [Flavobacteriaceae bacterium TP-CH-4]|uniref:Dipeptide epimerase n=1 Tax=Pelagihabitans pacificus TaxID=2696054 RepID=A0A967E9I5_9FLAO|nr:dipeptide epimerase [Pelagihabitans pacificus]NHF58501.1 dipeptide epimerase [Pelagihabitans pacificus]
MKIRMVSYERLNLPLVEPYTIAYETVAEVVNFVLRIETDTGLVGYGCAAPDKVVTLETPDQVEEAIKATVIPFLKGSNPYMFSRLIEEVAGLLNQQSSTLAMVDMALMDLLSKKMDVPLYQFLGGYRTSIPTSITIGIMSIDETMKRAKDYVEQGFFILKVKGGKSLSEDIEKMVLLREKYPSIHLRFDGNQGYSIQDALVFYRDTHDLNIEIFEQPTRIGKDYRMGKIREQIDIPIMADESLKTLKDIFRLAKNERVDMINIKLMKVGGIQRAIQMNAVAKAGNIESMVGCLDECRLGISAGLHFSLSRPNVKYADLDGHFDLQGDPFRNLFRLEKGILYPNTSPGLGVLNP